MTTQSSPVGEEMQRRLTEAQLANIAFDIANTKPASSPMGLFRQHCEDLLADRAELEREQIVLRAELRTQAQLHHSCGPHAPHFVPFAECKRASCVRAREVLGETK